MTSAVECEPCQTPGPATPKVDYEVAFDEEPVEPELPRYSKRRTLVGIAAALLVVGAVVAAVLTIQPTDKTTNISVGSAGDVSVCYDSYNHGNMENDFRRIKERFSGVRTYQTRGLRNHIEVAAQVGLTIYAGVWLKDDQWKNDMLAALDGAKRFPGSINAILVGNEELLGGQYNQWFVRGKVQEMKDMLAINGIKNIKVGSVQTDGDWLNSGRELAKECDVIGVNIHPFFGASDNSKWNPIEDLAARWNQMTRAFPGKSIVLTETGWPTSGSTYYGHVPSMDTAKKYVNDVNDWVKRGNGGVSPAHFMFHDNPGKWQDFEKSFGLAWSNGYWKFDFNTLQPAKDHYGIVFVNPQNDFVLAGLPKRVLETHKRWGGDWFKDPSSKWLVRESVNLIAVWDNDAKIDVCLDAYEPKNGGTVHLWPCDPNNGNQKWQYDRSTQQIRHITHRGYCLDMKYPSGGSLHLYTCMDVPLQKFEWWVSP